MLKKVSVIATVLVFIFTCVVMSASGSSLLDVFLAALFVNIIVIACNAVLVFTLCLPKSNICFCISAGALILYLDNLVIQAGLTSLYAVNAQANGGFGPAEGYWALIVIGAGIKTSLFAFIIGVVSAWLYVQRKNLANK